MGDAYAPEAPSRIAVAGDGAYAAIVEVAQVVVVALPALAVVSEVAFDPDAANDVAWLGDRLLVLARYPAHTTAHLVDVVAGVRVAEIRLESAMRLLAAVGAHALVVGGTGAAVLTALDTHLVPYQFLSRALPSIAGAAAGLFVVGLAGTVEEWDPASRMPKRRLRLPRAVAPTAIGGSERTVWLTTQQDSARVDVLPLVNRGQPKSHDVPEPIAAVHAHPRTDIIACTGAESSRLYLLDLDGRTRLRTLAPEGIERVDAAALVVADAIAVIAAQARRPLALVTLDGAPEPFADPARTARRARDEPTPPRRSTLTDADAPPALDALRLTGSAPAGPLPKSRFSKTPRSGGPPRHARDREGLQDAPPDVEGLQDAPPDVEGLQDAPPDVEGLQDAPVQVEGLQDTPVHVEGLQDAPVHVEGLQDAPAPTQRVSKTHPVASSGADGSVKTVTLPVPGQRVAWATKSENASERFSSLRDRGKAAPLRASWRDDLVLWARAILAGTFDRAAPLSPPIDALAARFELPASLAPAVALLYGAHLAGAHGAAPVDVARVLARTWEEALGRGTLAERGLATYERSRVILAEPVIRALDELPPRTGAIVGTPGAIDVLGPCVIVSTEPLDALAKRLLEKAGGAILVAAATAPFADVLLEARARGAIALVRLAAPTAAPPQPVIFVVADAGLAERLGVPYMP